MNSFQWLLASLLLLACWISVTNALYDIDNTNVIIGYQPSTGVNSWHVSDLLADYSNCYSDSAIYNFCETSDHCHISIPFTGRGIIIKVVQVGTRNNSAGLATNVNVTLDAGPPVTKTLYPINSTQFDVTLYSIDRLEWRDHTLDIALMSMVYPGRTIPYGTEMMFDYAIVNNTSPPFTATATSASSISSSVAPSTTSTTSPSTTNVPVVSTATHVNTGAIAGGVVGGLLGLLALTSFILRRRLKRDNELDSESKVNPFNVTSHTYDEPLPRTSTATSSFSSIPGAGHIPAALRDSVYSTADTKGSLKQTFARSITPSQSLHRLSSTLAAIRHDFPIPNAPASPTASNSTAPSINGQSVKRGRFRANSSLWESAGPPGQSRPSSAVSPEPTPLPAELSSLLMDLPDEQIEFVRGLVRVNVPIAEIIRVVEVMKEDREREGTGTATVGETTSMLNPGARTLYHDT